MNGGLGVNNDIDLVRTHVKQPARLDHFETLVDERCGIDRDAATHTPVRMSEGLLGRRESHFRKRRLSERSTGGRENQTLDIVLFSGAQALMDRIVLAVHGE